MQIRDIGGNVISSFPGSITGTTVEIPVGFYFVTETGPSDYTASFSIQCGGIAVDNAVLTCNVTNDDFDEPKAELKVTKTVINDDGGVNIPSDFTMQ
jgi:hypothetical protein